MVQRAHSVESMRCVTSAGVNCGTRVGGECVGVTDGANYATLGGVLDKFKGAGDFGRDRHQLYVTACSLPEALEQTDRGVGDVLRRMHAPLGVGDERPLHVNAHGMRTVRLNSRRS